MLIEGVVKRKPVSARDLAMINGIIYDKRALARSEPTGITGRSREDYLPGLNAYLEDFARKKERERNKLEGKADSDELRTSNADDEEMLAPLSG